MESAGQRYWGYMMIIVAARRFRRQFAARSVLAIAMGLLLTGCHHNPLTPRATPSRAVAVTSPAITAKPVISRPVQAYGFVHYETTGITSYLIVDGKEAAIQFRDDSSQLAIKSLYALKPGICLYNTDGKDIFLIGQLYDGVSHTPSAPYMATSEPYREFTLRQWYIVTPFRDCVNFDNPDAAMGDEKPRYTNRSSLKRSDFRDFPGLNKLDMRTLIQKRH